MNEPVDQQLAAALDILCSDLRNTMYTVIVAHRHEWTRDEFWEDFEQLFNALLLRLNRQYLLKEIATRQGQVA